MQIQVNALLLLLQRQNPDVPLREEFQRLISEGVQAVGVETMEAIKDRIRDGIIQEEMKTWVVTGWAEAADGHQTILRKACQGTMRGNWKKK